MLVMYHTRRIDAAPIGVKRNFVICACICICWRQIPVDSINSNYNNINSNYNSIKYLQKWLLSWEIMRKIDNSRIILLRKKKKNKRMILMYISLVTFVRLQCMSSIKYIRLSLDQSSIANHLARNRSELASWFKNALITSLHHRREPKSRVTLVTIPAKQ